MKHLIDQAAHFVTALAIAYLAMAYPGPVAGAMLGLAMGLIREITEAGPITSAGSVVDLCFWTLGGAVAGSLVG